MLTITNLNYTPSEVVQMLKDAQSWNKLYVCYLLKINRSGATTFADLDELVTNLDAALAKEVEEVDALRDEAAKTKKRLTLRGAAPSANAAVNLAPISQKKVLAADVAAIGVLMSTGKVGAGVTQGKITSHQTDPETGVAKLGSVTVTEYYINGPEGRRATKRTEKGKVTYYYSVSHTANTYQYARLVPA